MKYLIQVSAAMGICALLTVNAFSQATGSNGVFTIHNNTDNNIVTGFYTNDGDGWSQNWLGERLNPSDNAEATFTADTGSCKQLLQVGWLGSNNAEVMDDPININICEANNVYLEDNDILFD